MTTRQVSRPREPGLPRTGGTLALALLSLLAACGQVADPYAEGPGSIPAEFTRALAAGPATYVLTAVEEQRGEQIVIFDHQCDGTRFRTVVRDSITLLADGTARRAFVIDHLTNDSTRMSSAMEQTGRWEPLRRRNYHYYSDGPSIVVSLSSPRMPMAGELLLRLDGAHAVTTLAALGGSCPGSPNDAREGEFRYTRR